MQEFTPPTETLRAAGKALDKKDFQRAHALAMSVLQADPSQAEAYFLMARIAHLHGNVSKAEDIVRRALRFDTGNADYLLFRAQCLLELSQHEEVKALVSGLADMALDTAHQNDSLGVLHSRLGQHALALKRFQRACDIAPEIVNYQYNLAACQQFSGLFEQAESAYETAIKLDPAHFRSHSSLSQLRRQSVDNNHLERLHSLWQQLGKDADGRLHIGHALAKEYEDLEDYEQAMHYLVEAKAEKLRQSSEQDESALFATLGRVTEQLAAQESAGYNSREPIFIVGMPRTGTTLVERILSSHSSVESAGELANFSLLVKRQLGTQSQWVLDAQTLELADTLDFESLGREYLQSTRHLTGGSLRFIDKMPLNFMYVPLIAKALPNAKIVCLRRNPMDTCLSNYRQLFSTTFSYYNYAYSLTNTARFYTRFHQLMAEYERLLSGQLYQVHYETLVKNPEAEARQLMVYCDLPWEPDCLNFQRNTAPVATASSVQVREPIYQRGLERWKLYEPWLSEIKRELERAGIPHDS